jgi:hypothetical protein
LSTTRVSRVKGARTCPGSQARTKATRQHRQIELAPRPPKSASTVRARTGASGNLARLFIRVRSVDDEEACLQILRDVHAQNGYPTRWLLPRVLDAEHGRFRQRRLRREWRLRGKWRLRRERRFGLRSIAVLVRADDNRSSPDAPPDSTLGLARDSRVAFHRLAHRVDRPGVLLDFPDRIVTTHASRRLATIGRRACSPEPSPNTSSRGIPDRRLWVDDGSSSVLSSDRMTTSKALIAQ